MNTMEKYLVYYYLHNSQYSDILSLASKNTAQPEFKLYECLVFVVLGQYVEAIRRLGDITRSEADVNMATLLLLIYSHKKCMDPDYSLITDLESQLRQCHPCSNERSLTLACVCLYFTRLTDKAQGLAEKVVKLNASCVDARLVMAWIEMEKKSSKCVNEMFRAIISLDPKCINALLGDVLSTSSRSEQLSKLNRILVQFPHIAPPLIEKMKLLLISKDWQQCNELCERLLAINGKSSVANKMKVFYLINVAGQYQEAAQLLTSCYHTILRQEIPDPCQVLYDWAKLFARICGRNKDILLVTLSYAKHCADTCPTSVSYIEEFAYQSYLVGKYEEALRLYRVAIKLDDTSLSLLTGLTMSQFEAGGRVMSEQISQQLDLLTEISSKSPYISLIRITQLKSPPSDIQSTLDSIVRHQMALVARQPFGFQYLIELNMDLLLSVLTEYLKLDNSSVACMTLLEHMTSLAPGLLVASLLLASLHIREARPDRSSEQAKRLLAAILDTRPEYSVAHMMLSLVHFREGDFNKGSHHLELALSNDLKLIETPLYNALKGLSEDHKGRVVESIHSLRTTRQLIHASQETHNQSTQSILDLASIEHRILFRLDPSDLSLVYQKLCSNLDKSNLDTASSELDKYIAEASSLLKGTKHWTDLSIVIAEVKEKSEPKVSLELLKKVPEQHARYVQAVEKMAAIYLTSLKSPDKYIDCYRNLLDKDPSTDNYARLAEAYLNIQDADKAVVTYETARRHNPNARFGLKLARIFVRTHQYEKALASYKECREDEEALVELATLYVNLGHVDVARECLVAIQRPQLTAPVMAKIKEKSRDVKAAYQILKQALDTCPELQTAATYRQLATYATQLRDFQSAISHYRKLLGERLSVSEAHSVHIALTKLYMQINDWKSCEALCSQLLASGTSGSQETHNSETTARLILADATFRRGDFAAASEHFGSLLADGDQQGEGVNFTALARYIEIQRRLATLASCERSLLDKMGPGGRGVQSPGYYYCQGLYEWYSGNVTRALGQFHRAKYDTEWGQQSLHNMVEICLANPEAVQSTDGSITALDLAETLIKEMNPASPEEDWSCKLLSNFLRSASHDRIDGEMALNEFTRLAQNEGTRVGASLGLAKCYVNQNQSARARNILKLLAKSPWNFEEANYLEACWLLLAEIYIQDSRPDRATELIQRTLSYNKSSAKCYELLASIAETREHYEEAAGYYKQACRMLGAADLSLHPKFAALLLKMRRYADCIDVCQTMRRVDSAAHRQVYEKALSQLRT